MSSQGSQPVTSTDLGFIPQRLYMTRRRARERAAVRLRSNAYSLLGAADQATILAAVNGELNTRVDAIMRGRVARQLFPYDGVIEAAIAKVYHDNLALFPTAGEDELTVDELLRYEG